MNEGIKREKEMEDNNEIEKNGRRKIRQGIRRNDSDERKIRIVLV